MAGKSPEEKLNRSLCQPGAKVFYWDDVHAWALGTVQQDDGKFFTVQGYGYSCTKVDDLGVKGKVAETKIWPIREDVLDEDTDDLLQLTVLHDATIQRCLFVRYMKDTCYTNIGAITVALNPWNFTIPKYVDAKMPDYLAEGDRIKNNVPHSWAQAHNTWHEMREDSQNQCILISGESGAGKTEAAKIVMKYLGALSCMTGSDKDKEGAKKVAFNINQASPILEGFGNAKTVRNDNSSRFGKFMKVQFDAGGFLVGAQTTKYLLEKSRIITANPNERIYHSFYLLSKGSDAGKYNVKTAAHYASTCNAGGCVDIPKVDDGEDYTLCVEAMRNCGFSADEIDGTWRMVAGALHLGTVHFKEIDKDSCDFVDKTGVGESCQQWQTDGAVLERELMWTTMQTRDGPVDKRLNLAKSTDSRDSLIRTTYDNLFGWQVSAINNLTDSGTGKNFIGLLDIFGFEDFEYNSFEQLCINLANETLQNHYNTYIFTKDMDECRAEGIDVTEVKCPDNMPCLKLMTAKTGIFGKLDDESNLPSGTDIGFLEKVKDEFAAKGKEHPFFGVKRMSKDSFIVHHYAASVNYTVEDWLEKNRDALKPELKLFMRASAQPLLKTLLPEPEEAVKKITVGGFFKQQLSDMMDLINSTNPHWIRCVKPHPAKKPLMVHGEKCMGQLESSGVLGTVKIRKAGFPVRTAYDKFVARFKCLAGGAPARGAPLAEVQAYCKKIVAGSQIEPLKAQCGRTKMFLKNDANQKLEADREKALRVHVQRLNGFARAKISDMVTARRRLEHACRHTQAEVRDWLKRSAAQRAEREARRQALLEQMRALLGPFEQEREAARAAIEKEESDAFAEIALARRQEQAGMLSAVMAVVETGEQEARRPIEAEEAAAWAQIFRVAANEGASMQLLELERLEERMRREIEQAWWVGGDPPTPPQPRRAASQPSSDAHRTGAVWGPAREVTGSVLRPPGGRPHVTFAGSDRGPETAGAPGGMQGVLTEYFSHEMRLLEYAGDWSEECNRGEIRKAELRRRQELYRLFMVDWVDARLDEEDFYEEIWRADIAEQEHTAHLIDMRWFFQEQLRFLVDPPSLKGTFSEPPCRLLVEKDQRDKKRMLLALWRVLRWEGFEEMVRSHVGQREDLCRAEAARRAEVERDAIRVAGEFSLMYRPLQTNAEEEQRLREQRWQRRARKLRKLRRLWQAEMDGLERQREQYYEGWRDHERGRLEVVERELDPLPAPGALSDAAGLYGELQLAQVSSRGWPTPDGREPFASLVARRREMERFKRWMDSVENAVSSGGAPPPSPPPVSSAAGGRGPETLWEYLRRLQADANWDQQDERAGMIEAVRRLGAVSPAALEAENLARVEVSPRGAAAASGQHSVDYDTRWKQPVPEVDAHPLQQRSPASPPPPPPPAGFDAAVGHYVTSINQALAATDDILVRERQRRYAEEVRLRELAGVDPAGPRVWHRGSPADEALHVVPAGNTSHHVRRWESMAGGAPHRRTHW